MTDYDLRAALAEFLDTSDLLGPQENAAKFAENVPARHLRTALAAALVPYTRHVLVERRAVEPALAAAGNRNSARSAKSAAIREAWRRTLAGQFHVGGGQWRRLADCSLEDVLYLAEERRLIAARTLVVAGMFDDLASVMKRRRAARVGDLTDAVLAGILTAPAEVAA